MARIVYIGDEATAAGFRLAGVDTRVAAPGDAAETLRRALGEGSECVLFDGKLVEFVPPAELADALMAGAPLFTVIPDVRGCGAPPDLAGTVRNALGIEA
jgi:vacuolar-type H+-ATPase subunit F/Vma7